MKKIFILLLLLTLTGCKETVEPDTEQKDVALILSIPTGISYSDELLDWDMVTAATNYIVKINDETITTTDSEYSFAGYANGSYDVKVKANSGSISSKYTSVQTIVIADHKPYITSQSTVDYSNQDLGFTFELYNGVFTDISGSEITTEDYVIENSKLTIKSDFIDRILLAEPQKDTIIIGYVLTSSDEITVGYLFINIP